MYREKIKKEIEKILNESFLTKLDYDKDQITSNNYDLSLKDARMEFEKEYLLSQIKRFNGNITKVSEFTGTQAKELLSLIHI